MGVGTRGETRGETSEGIKDVKGKEQRRDREAEGTMDNETSRGGEMTGKGQGRDRDREGTGKV